jgi:hypothetical protein
MGTTPSGFVCFGVALCDEEGNFLGTLTDEAHWDDEDALGKMGLSSKLCGYDGNLGHILAVKGSVTTSEWGEVESIAHSKDVQHDPAVDAMREYCAKYEIPCEPNWVVSSLYF